MQRTIPTRAQKRVVELNESLTPPAEEIGKHDDVDLLEIIKTNPTAFPLQVAGWNILIEMVRPKDKMGIFYKTTAQLQAEDHLTVMGRVLMVGPTALQGKTESGIELSQLTATIKTPADLIGKFVIHQQYTGAMQWFTPMPGKKLKYITATEILGITTVPSMFIRP